MPELPEVESVIRYLKSKILNIKITNIEVLLSKFLKNTFIDVFRSSCVDCTIIDIKRKGKYIFFFLNNKKVFVFHLRMEGKFFVFNKENIKENAHNYIWFYFENDLVLIYNDTRQFGTVHLFDNIEEALNSKEIKKLGIDPLTNNFDIDYLIKITKNNRQKIKTFLLDQTNISGIGNIYADEILFSAKINPFSVTNKIPKENLVVFVSSCKKILLKSIKYNGTTIHSFKIGDNESGSYQQFLQVHGQKNCKKCKNKIIKEKQNGRGTYYCLKCQVLFK